MLQPEHGRIELANKAEIVGGDNHRRPEALVQFGKEPHKARAHFRVDIPGGLIGDQKIRLGDQGAGDGHALLFAARQRGRACIEPCAKADPAEQFFHISLVVGLLAPDHPQRQRGILVSGQMIEQPEFLEHDAHPAAHGGQLVARQVRCALAKEGDFPVARTQGQIEQLQQTRLAGTGRTGQEGERTRFQNEINAAKDIFRGIVAQGNGFEADRHVVKGVESEIAHAQPIQACQTKSTHVAKWTKLQAMILTCPSCDTQYFADDDTIGDSGRTVKCTACDHSWFVRPDGVAVDPEEAGDAGVAAIEGAHEKYRQQVRERRRQRSRFAALMSWLVTASLFFSLGAGAVVLRNDVVKIWPESATAYRFVGLEVNRFGLDFIHRQAARTFDGTTPILTVEGEVENTSRTAQQTPKVRVSLHDEFNREVGEIYADIEPRRLDAGEIGTFSAKLENPPVASVSLNLQFVELGGARTDPQSAGRVDAVEPLLSETETGADPDGGGSDTANITEQTP